MSYIKRDPEEGWRTWKTREIILASGGEYGNISHNLGKMGDSKGAKGDLSMIRSNQDYYPSNTDTAREKEGLTKAAHRGESEFGYGRFEGNHGS